MDTKKNAFLFVKGWSSLYLSLFSTVNESFFGMLSCWISWWSKSIWRKKKQIGIASTYWPSHRIHGTGVFIYIWLFFMANVDTYTSPMYPMVHWWFVICFFKMDVLFKCVKLHTNTNPNIFKVKHHFPRCHGETTGATRPSPTGCVLRQQMF